MPGFSRKMAWILVLYIQLFSKFSGFSKTPPQHTHRDTHKEKDMSSRQKTSADRLNRSGVAIGSPLFHGREDERRDWNTMHLWLWVDLPGDEAVGWPTWKVKLPGVGVQGVDPSHTHKTAHSAKSVSTNRLKLPDDPMTRAKRSLSN